jgi:spore maturation protein SpmA
MMGWIYTGLITLSVTASFMLGQGSQLALAIPQGAQAGINLALSMAGSICLWTGVGRLMEKAGFTKDDCSNFQERLVAAMLQIEVQGVTGKMTWTVDGETVKTAMALVYRDGVAVAFSKDAE